MHLVSAHPLSRVGAGRFALLVSLPIFPKVAWTIDIVAFLKILNPITRTGDQDVTAAYFTLSKDRMGSAGRRQQLCARYAHLDYL
jgi:hypothetical protein